MTDRPAIADLTACCWPTLSLDQAEIERLQAYARERHPGAPVVESCQRTEAYTLGPCECDAPLRLHGAEALFHLGEVAAGLHSVVLGEAQILGQVRLGFAAAARGLRRWSDVALAAARDLRRETDFNSHAGALLDRGLTLANTRRRGRLLVLGAGQMGRLVAERGRHLGFRDVTVVARRPHDLGSAFGYVALHELGTAGTSGVIAGCLGSGADAIDLADLPRTRLVLDFGTPRNFVGESGVPLLTLADLMGDQERRPHAMRRRRQLRGALRRKMEVRIAAERFDGRTPVGVLRAEVEAVRLRELERMRRLHPEIAPETLDVLTRSLVNQLFHAPSERLKAREDDALGHEIAALFSR